MKSSNVNFNKNEIFFEGFFAKVGKVICKVIELLKI